MPITLDLENVRHKRENNILQQIRTNPPSPQCFSAGLTKPNPSKGSRSRLMVCSNSTIKLFLLIDDALLANIRLDKIKLYHHLIDCGMYISHRLPYRVGYYQCRKLEECFWQHILLKLKCLSVLCYVRVESFWWWSLSCRREEYLKKLSKTKKLQRTTAKVLQ